MFSQNRSCAVYCSDEVAIGVPSLCVLMLNVYWVQVVLTVTSWTGLSNQPLPLGSLVIKAKLTVRVPVSVLNHTLIWVVVERSQVPARLLLGALASRLCATLLLLVKRRLPMFAGDFWDEVVAVPEMAIHAPLVGLSDSHLSHVVSLVGGGDVVCCVSSIPPM